MQTWVLKYVATQSKQILIWGLQLATHGNVWLSTWLTRGSGWWTLGCIATTWAGRCRTEAVETWRKVVSQQVHSHYRCHHAESQSCDIKEDPTCSTWEPWQTNGSDLAASSGENTNCSIIFNVCWTLATARAVWFIFNNFIYFYVLRRGTLWHSQALSVSRGPIWARQRCRKIVEAHPQLPNRDRRSKGKHC